MLRRRSDASRDERISETRALAESTSSVDQANRCLAVAMGSAIENSVFFSPGCPGFSRFPLLWLPFSLLGSAFRQIFAGGFPVPAFIDIGLYLSFYQKLGELTSLSFRFDRHGEPFSLRRIMV